MNRSSNVVLFYRIGMPGVLPGILLGILLGVLTLASAALLLQPADAQESQGFLDKAATEFSQGKYDSAAKNYRKALKVNPKEPNAYLGLSMALKATGDVNGSKAILQELIRLYPNFAPAYYNLGEVLESQGDMEGAKAAYRSFIQYSGGQLPRSPEVRIKFRKMGLL